ncbi:MAG: hypothetical protein ACI9LG_003389 [Moritella dasanensis]|jgi:hypothetical protein
MNTYKLHRYLGYLLILPVTLWALTGAFFLVKPGYKNAYEQLQITSYPLTSTLPLLPKPEWQAIAINRSILGSHYRVKVDQQWQHINPLDNQIQAEPSPQSIINLLQDAVKHNPARYGSVLNYQDGIAFTDTKVKLMFDWSRLSLRQQGADSRFFNTMYDIHYLRWTGNKVFDQWFGYIGLGLLVLMALTGVVMVRKSVHKIKAKTPK